jgi:hypothetical protein
MAVSWALGGCAVGAIIHHPQFSCESAASRKTEEETYTAFEYCILWSSVEGDVENADKAKVDEIAGLRRAAFALTVCCRWLCAKVCGFLFFS